MCLSYNPLRWLTCCLPKSTSTLTFITTRILFIYIILTSILHVSVFVLAILSMRGIHVPVIQTLNQMMDFCYTHQPKDFEPEASVSDAFLRLGLSIGHSSLSSLKTLILVMTGGQKLVGNITIENYIKATSSWNGIIVHAISYAIYGLAYGFDTCMNMLIVTVAKPSQEWSVLLSSGVYTIAAIVATYFLFFQIHPRRWRLGKYRSKEANEWS